MNRFKKRFSLFPKKNACGDNPYLNAKRAWNTHVAGLMSSLLLWQTTALIALLIGLSAVSGMIYVAKQSKFIPLVFREDKSGNLISMTRADALPKANKADLRAVAAKFIESIRLVTVDSELQRQAVLNVYAFLSANDPATLKANEYLNGSKEANPFQRAMNETVSVDIRSVLQQSPEAWQVDWLETIRTRDGALKQKPILMRAILALYQGEPTHDTTEIEALRNPHFIFVRDVNWSSQLGERQ